ncbi:MAG TPA: HNH endonuclease [Vicinamibacterales bacterium]|nr:HNH endonuclease [Vicinamibacterales bacterium]
MTDPLIADATALRDRVASLRRDRELRKTVTGRRRRFTLKLTDRQRILAKTASQCHICGGQIEGPWQADHVLAHSGGGCGDPDNYLASHALCNNYRWDYLPEEFQLILRLGVWARTQIERGTTVGNEIARRFGSSDAVRIARRRTPKGGGIERAHTGGAMK